MPTPKIKNGLAEMVYTKTGISLSSYCRIRGIRVIGSYVSDKAAAVLDADGIEWREARGVKVKGGSCGAFRYLTPRDDKDEKQAG